MDALILAGGENSRIPFLKGFLEINGTKIIESNVRLLKGIFNRVLISTNSPELYFYLGTLMVGDMIKHRGPMAGIYSALNVPDVSDVFVIACDMPFINVILIQHIISKWDEKWDSVIPVFDNRPQPLFGIYSQKITGKIEDTIKKERMSLRELLKRINVLYIKEEEVRSIDTEGKSFVNINTMEDFKKEGGKLCLEHRI
jgi:molybdopterin-guanine dinucleotide biosynthesis protein A